MFAAATLEPLDCRFMGETLLSTQSSGVVDEIDRDIRLVEDRMERRQREQEEDQREIDQLRAFKAYWLKRHPEATARRVEGASNGAGTDRGPKLKEILRRVLATGGRMTVAEARKGAERVGWHTTSKVPSTRVRNTLYELVESGEAGRDGDYYFLLAGQSRNGDEQDPGQGILAGTPKERSTLSLGFQRESESDT
jgi:hypothetical protein